MTRRIERLGPGEPLTDAAIHALVDQGRRSSLIQGPVATQQPTRSGIRTTPIVPLAPFMAYLTGHHDDETDEKYEWKEAISERGEWKLKERGLESNARHTEYSPVADYAEGDPGTEPEKVLLNPAVEVNGVMGIPDRTLVRLIPGQRFYNKEKKTWVKPFHFTFAREPRAFELLEDLVPERIVDDDAGDPEYVPTCRVKVRLLESALPFLGEGENQDLEEVWAYPCCQRYFLTEPLEDDDDDAWRAASIAGDVPVLNYGLGRGPLGHEDNESTRGWLIWTDDLREEDSGEFDDQDPPQPVYNRIGGYQIVTLYAELHCRAKVFDVFNETDDYKIPDGESGTANLMWNGKDYFGGHAIAESGYQIGVHNVAGHDIHGGCEYDVKFDRTSGEWLAQECRRHRYAEVQEDWQSGAVPAYPSIPTACWASCKICKADGTIINTDEFDINFDRPRPRPNALDPSVYEDDIIEWCYDNENRAKAIGPNLFDSAVGDIKMGSWALADIPPGWHECDGSNQTNPLGVVIALMNFTEVGTEGSHFPKHAEAPVVPGAFGGFKLHGVTENNHLAHPNHRHQLDGASAKQAAGAGCLGAGQCWDAVAGTQTVGVQTLGGAADPHINDHDGNDTDNRPPWTTVHFIERYR